MRWCVALVGSGNPVLPASTQVSLGGADVCIVGAVTQETPTLVSPGGVAGLTFSDPVAAVNKEVARLAGANVDCDATIASYHVRFIDQPPRGTSYTRVVDGLVELMEKIPIRNPQRVTLIVDATGVRRPVVDQMVQKGLNPIPVVTTAGQNASITKGALHVPQKVLVLRDA